MQVSNKIQVLIAWIIFVWCPLDLVFGEESGANPKYWMISGSARWDNQVSVKLNINDLLRELESEAKDTFYYFKASDILGYAEEKGKFWIVVSNSHPPLSSSSAVTLYGHLLAYKKNRITIHDLRRVEFQFFQNRINISDKPQDQIPKK